MIYTVSVSAFDNHRRSAPATETTDVDLASGETTKEQLESSLLRERRRGLNLTGRLQWRPGDGESLSLSPNLFHTEARNERDFRLVQSIPAGPGDYDFGNSETTSRFTVGRLTGQWKRRLAPALRLETSGHVGAWQSFADTRRLEFFDGQSAPNRTLADQATTRERSANLASKLLHTWGGDETRPGSEHSLVGGLEAETVRRTETHTTLDNGSNELGDGFGDDLQAWSLRAAAYVQDEWSVSPHWAAHAGLRWEGITSQGDSGNGDRPTNRSNVLSPLAHAVWKPDPKGRDQLRFSLTRSYRSPALAALIARPAVSPKFPASGANDPTSPDRAGNPDLKPELATGIDIAAERYLPGGGLLSANLFQRRISNLMRSVTTLETVSWSPVPRWVARQQNIGDAVTRGVELEVKFTLDQLVDGAPKVDLHANAAFFRSRVDSVPGPDNRLDQQPRATANLGADYRWRGLPLTLGGNLNAVPGGAARLAEDQRVAVSTKRIVDAYLLWVFDPALALRVTASNLAPRDYESSNTIVATSFAETARSFGPSFTNWQLRLEFKL